MIYMRTLFFIFLLPLQLQAQPFSPAEISRWQNQSQQVTIIRDNWGIPHIYGKSDADAVFGLLYAQCEDGFNRVEMNYIEKLGRTAEIKGAAVLQNDLYIRLLIDSADAVADYNKSPDWLKKLLNAYADGINFYLYKHPEVKPALLNRFQPWYPLLWTDGSIGAISTGNITADEVRPVYLPASTNEANAIIPEEDKTTGSNGFAVGPSKTASGNAILYINPHVTFYFRPEVHMVSEEGLNVYGAVTWGQFFIYQGFNEYCGWMHTSSNVDVADMYSEKLTFKNGRFYYQYNNALKPVVTKEISLSYKNSGGTAKQNITAYYTAHGPVMARRNEQWISVKSNNRSLNGLIQCWERTKAKGFLDFKKTMELRGNTSNNTVFADNRGHIAYWHGDFVPKRNPMLNWSKVVDGSISATEWQGLHSLDEIVHVYDPESGWIQNCNSTPYTCSDSSSPKKEDYPAYMAPDGENFRAINAARLLGTTNNYTIDKIITTGYDTKLSAFEVLIPALIKAYDKNLQPGDSLYYSLQVPVSILRRWNYQASEYSVATTLAVEWAQHLTAAIQKIYIEAGDPDQVLQTKKFTATALPNDLLMPLYTAINELTARFGRWDLPWGQINRYQRISGAIDQQFNDDKESLPVAFTSSTWGMLPAYNSRYLPGVKKRYGVSGNSFICAVEFGTRIKAKSLLAGGQNSDPASPHFTDQLNMYSKGKFKDVLFYKEDVLQHVEKTYHPGE
jgi:acyl-homoserine lactone acylase PvdQ